MSNEVVIVLDLGNYKAKYAEEIPFNAKIVRIEDGNVWVKSMVTGDIYEVYENQLLEYLSIDEIRALIDLKQYGK